MNRDLLEYSMCFTYIFLKNGDSFILKKFMNSHASLILFWESLNIMVIYFGYKFSPNMIGIQEGYNKNSHIKCIEYYGKFDSL